MKAVGSPVPGPLLLLSLCRCSVCAELLLISTTESVKEAMKEASDVGRTLLRALEGPDAPRRPSDHVKSKLLCAWDILANLLPGLKHTAEKLRSQMSADVAERLAPEQRMVMLSQVAKGAPSDACVCARVRLKLAQRNCSTDRSSPRPLSTSPRGSRSGCRWSNAISTRCEIFLRYSALLAAERGARRPTRWCRRCSVPRRRMLPLRLRGRSAPKHCAPRSPALLLFARRYSTLAFLCLFVFFCCKFGLFAAGEGKPGSTRADPRVPHQGAGAHRGTVRLQRRRALDSRARRRRSGPFKCWRNALRYCSGASRSSKPT